MISEKSATPNQYAILRMDLNSMLGAENGKKWLIIQRMEHGKSAIQLYIQHWPSMEWSIMAYIWETQ